MQWTVVIPAKALPAAKSRLAGVSDGAAAHRRLVEAIRADTVAAARGADGVARVVVVVDRPTAPGTAAAPDGPVVLVQREPGLNAALHEAAGYAGRAWPADGVAALVGDLPALRSTELSAALNHAAAHDRSFVPDAAGTGTTLLAVTPGHALQPEFGAGSAARHAAAATPLAAGDGLRHDVDTSGDLDAAAALGLGPATRIELAHVTRRSTSRGIVRAMRDAPAHGTSPALRHSKGGR